MISQDIPSCDDFPEPRFRFDQCFSPDGGVDSSVDDDISFPLLPLPYLNEMRSKIKTDIKVLPLSSLYVYNPSIHQYYIN